MTRLSFVIAATLAAAAIQPVQAQNAPLKSSTIGNDEVVVVGTRRTDRSVMDSASPVDVISSAELRTQPASNLLDQLKYVVPSFFVGQNTISDGSSVVRPPSLRGLPADEILVMLNGKRFNRSALVQVYGGGDTELSYGSQGSDISSIPSIAIKRLEVLRDGATAQYGSDAIAGVLNYGLRDDTGLEAQVRYGEYQQHHDGKSYQYAVNGGTALGERGFINLSAEYDDDGQTSRGVTRPNAYQFAQENPGLASQIPNYPLPAQIWGNSPTHGYKLLLNSSLAVTDSSNLYLIANVAETKVDVGFNHRSALVGTRPFTTTTGDVYDIGGNGFFQHPYYQTPCPTNNPTCPAGGYVQDTNAFNLSSRYPGGFTPHFFGDTTQAYGTVGYKGKTDAGLGYDLSASSSRNAVDLSLSNSFSPTYGGASQTHFALGKQIQKETDANLDLTYPIKAGMASDLTLSGGAEFRREQYETTAGDLQAYGAGPYGVSSPLYVQTSPGVYAPTGNSTVADSPGASGYGGTSPTYVGSHSQNSHAFYVGLEGDVVKSLSVGLAGRYESYDTFGSATVGKLNAIWHLDESVALRATLGSGFHAPSPGQNNTQVLTTTFGGGKSLQSGTFPVTSGVAQFYGAKPLKPERSTNFGAGLVLKPWTDVTATIDAYKIDVKDRIFISRSYTVTDADIAALPELASVGADGTVQYFTNSLDTSTRGVDAVASYRIHLGSDPLDLSLAYNYNQTTVTKSDPAAIGTYQIIDIERLSPNHRATLSAVWSRGALGITLRENYFGSWVDSNDYPTALDSNFNVTAGQVFGAKITTDLDISYTFLSRYTASIGASNLFDVRPDKIAATPYNPIYKVTGGTEDGSVYPRNGGPFGMNGAFWYAGLRAKF